MAKKGDTLIEVTLAVGIFSMIAIAITSVMSGGTSNAQTALETTLAREEIDAQAEALRFIQSSYVADRNAADQRYSNLWHAITGRAYTINTSGEIVDDPLQFAPNTCKELYEPNGSNTIFTQKAFIINTRKLATFTADTTNTVLIAANTTNPGSESVLTQTVTYPRIVYGTSSNNTGTTSSLVGNDTQTNIYKAEGIYIIAVKEADKANNDNTTSIVTDNTIENKSAFYDFYIRTCWYGADAKSPSTISTVIRLYDPDVISTDD